MFLSDNTYLFENTEHKNFNLDCVRLLIDENRFLRNKIDAQSSYVQSIEEELRRLKRLSQYYPKGLDNIILELDAISQENSDRSNLEYCQSGRDGSSPIERNKSKSFGGPSSFE